MAGVGTLSNIAGSDPRANHGLVQGDVPDSVKEVLHDPNITIEEYMYWAKISRADEDRLYKRGGEGGAAAAVPGTMSMIKSKILRKHVETQSRPRLSISAQGEPVLEQANEKNVSGSASEKKAFQPMVVTDEEWVQASRAARTATWSTIFYLITTDILGPFSTGYAFSTMGLGPGVALFTVFGALAGYTGWQLWRLFVQLDSDRYPMKGYGDIAFRVYGAWFRHTVNFLQSFQFFLNVALIALSSGQSISQMSKNGLCFIVCILVAAIAGCLIGQIRTLQRFGWLASCAVYINFFVIFATMGVMAHSPPNYKIWLAAHPNEGPPPPIQVSGSAPPGLSFTDNIGGLMNAVFSFGGATLFVELMAEMRRPMDFWKGLLCADLLIYICYMVYGIYCYCMQGQYVYNNSYQGISPYNWQTVCNALELLTGVIAAVLYGNIGIKVFYNNVGRDLLRFPRLETKVGKWLWVVIVPSYWMLAFVVSASVPQLNSW